MRGLSGEPPHPLFFTLLLFTSSKNEDYQKILLPLFSLLLFTSSKNDRGFSENAPPPFSLFLFSYSYQESSTTEDFQKMHPSPPPFFLFSYSYQAITRITRNTPPHFFLLFTPMNKEDYQKKTPHSYQQTRKIIKEAPPPPHPFLFTCSIHPKPRSSVSWVTG